MTSKEPLAGTRVLWVAGFLLSFVAVEPAPVDLVLVVASALWIVYERMQIPATGLVLGSIYLACSVFSQILAGLNGVTADAAVIRDLIIESYLVLAAVVLYARFSSSPASLAAFVRGLVAGAVLTSTLIVLLHYGTEMPQFLYRDDFRVRISGFFKDPNVLGPFLILPILLLTFRNEIVTWRIRRLAAFPCVALLALTYSRGAYVGLLVAVTLVMVVITFREKVSAEALLAAVSLLVFGGGLAIAFWSKGLPGVDLNTSRLGVQVHDVSRFTTLSDSIDYALRHPFGNGLRSFGDAFGSNPHNLFLGKAADAGLIAAGLSVLVPARAAYVLRRMEGAAERMKLLVAAALVGNLIVSSVIYSHHWRHLYFLIATAFALAAMTADPAPTIDLRAARPPRTRPESRPDNVRALEI